MKLPFPLTHALATLVALAAAPVAAQQATEGYAEQVRPLSAGTTQIRTLTLLGHGGGGEIYFDGTALVLTGIGSPRQLLTFAAPVFGSFLIEADHGQVLFGESTTGGVWLVPLNGPTPVQPIATMPYNYDAVMLAPTQAIVSAKTGGFTSPDRDLLLLDFATGLVRQLAVMPGASGPVAMGGGLFYATAPLAYPAPPGQVAILRFDHSTVLQALNSSQVLGPSDAQTLFSGIDAASDIALDDDGDLFFVDWFRNVIGEVDEVAGPTPRRKDLIAYAAAAVYPAALQFVPGGPGPFEPFARHSGALGVLETDYGALNQFRVVAPRSADLASSVPDPMPSGTFVLRIANGPRGGPGLIALALAPPLPYELAFGVPGFEQPLLWLPVLLVPSITQFVAFDAMGGAALTLSNPGFAPALDAMTQAAFVDASVTVLGATPPLAVRLSQ